MNTSMQLNSINVQLGGGFGSTDFVGNLDFGEGSAQVTVTDQMGAVFTFTLSNGQNFFTLTASDNEVITDIQVIQEPGSTGPFGFNDFKQPRFSGICTLQGATCSPVFPPVVPEPASLAILGGALAGFGVFFRRRRSLSD